MDELLSRVAGGRRPPTGTGFVQVKGSGSSRAGEPGDRCDDGEGLDDPAMKAFRGLDQLIGDDVSAWLRPSAALATGCALSPRTVSCPSRGTPRWARRTPGLSAAGHGAAGGGGPGMRCRPGHPAARGVGARSRCPTDHAQRRHRTIAVGPSVSSAGCGLMPSTSPPCSGSTTDPAGWPRCFRTPRRVLAINPDPSVLAGEGSPCGHDEVGPRPVAGVAEDGRSCTPYRTVAGTSQLRPPFGTNPVALQLRVEVVGSSIAVRGSDRSRLSAQRPRRDQRRPAAHGRRAQLSVRGSRRRWPRGCREGVFVPDQRSHRRRCRQHELGQLRVAPMCERRAVVLVRPEQVTLAVGAVVTLRAVGTAPAWPAGQPRTACRRTPRHGPRFLKPRPRSAPIDQLRFAVIVS